jgi:hypothetical protein
VKWDVGGKDNPVTIREQDGETTIKFDSAWESPLRAIRTMSALYPTLLFELTYFESGCCFAGEARFVAGEGQASEYEEGEPGYERIGRAFGWHETDDDEYEEDEYEEDE